MNYIVFDLEWNQAADLRTRRANSLLFEIIEIGAVKLNEKKEQIDDFHELIKPQVFHTMNQVTGDLIHLKMEQLEDCRSLPRISSSGAAVTLSFAHGETSISQSCRKTWTTTI